jgi:ubiquinone biosynthesis protein Coq4
MKLHAENLGKVYANDVKRHFESDSNKPIVSEMTLRT